MQNNSKTKWNNKKKKSGLSYLSYKCMEYSVSQKPSVQNICPNIQELKSLAIFKIDKWQGECS